jgi:pre-mRNA-splicing helicase BRR2
LFLHIRNRQTYLNQHHHDGSSSKNTLTYDVKDRIQVLSVGVKLCKALVDVAAQSCQNNNGCGSLRTTLVCCELSQLLVQGLLPNDSLLYQIPYFNTSIVQECSQHTVEDDEGMESSVDSVLDILDMDDDVREKCLSSVMEHMNEIAHFCNMYPSIDVKYDVKKQKGKDTIDWGDTITLTVYVERDGDEDEDEDEDEADQSIPPPVLSRFPVGNHQEEWWIIVGDESNDKLMGIKRIKIPRKGTTKKKIKMTLPSSPAPSNDHQFNLKMFVISDSYRGCDEERDIQIM